MSTNEIILKKITSVGGITQFMIKNIIALFLTFVIIVSLASSKVLALRGMGHHDYGIYESEHNFLNNIGLEKLRSKFFEKFKLFDDSREENKNLIKKNRELNKEIKDKLTQNKGSISNDIWKEIRKYKNEINDNKISTRDQVRDLIDKQKEYLQSENYSDESIEEFINVLISVQKLKKQSIEFEESYLHKINDLI